MTCANSCSPTINDKRGEDAARQAASELDPKGIHCHRIKWPGGIKDACDYFTYHKATGFKGTAESFASLLAVAPRIGFERAEPPSAQARLTLVERTDESATFRNGTVSYRVKGLGGNGLRVVLTARKIEDGGASHIDTLDLYAARARKGLRRGRGGSAGGRDSEDRRRSARPTRKPRRLAARSVRAERSLALRR